MSRHSRRSFVLGAGALTMTAAGCANGVGNSGAAGIDARVDATLNAMYARYPGTRSLRDKSVGILVIPTVTKAGFGLGGSYGRGALRINGATVDYYSVASGTFGLQIGAQQYAQVLFFMTEPALNEFRRSSGWAAGGDIEYAVSDKGGNLSADTTTALSPIIAVIFGQKGLAIGATIEGSKYTRIIP